MNILSLNSSEHNDETLKEIKLSNKKLNISDFRTLVRALAKNTHACVLDISGNPLIESNIELLAQIPNITSLIAVNCEIDDTGASILAKNKTFKILNLSKNHIGDEGAIFLSTNTIVDSLNLFRNRIGNKGADALAKSSMLKSLNIGYNSLQGDGISAFEENTVLTTLVISGNFFDSKGILALTKNTTLTSLDVSYNSVNDETAILLAQHPNLIYLDLSYNKIGFEGANALGNNKKLKTLLMSHNMLEDNSIIALAKHITLEKLDLARNRVGFTGAYALSQNYRLNCLVLSFNLLGDSGAIILSTNTTLRKLYVSYNQIGDNGAIALARNKTLKKLNLNYNNIGKIGKKELNENITFSLLTVSDEQPPDFTEENLETIFLLSEDFLCISSQTGIIQFFNPAFSRILGYTSDELLAQPSLKFLHPHDKKAFKERLANKDQGFFENRYRAKDGSYHLIRWSTKIKHNRIYAVGSDLTEKTQLKKALESVKEKSLKIRLQESEAFAKQLTDFIAQLSHEIRNPLAGVYGQIEIINDDINFISNILDASQDITYSAIKEKIQAKTKEMQKIIGDIAVCLDYQKTIMDDNLDLAKITEKKLTLNKKALDLTQEMLKIINMLKPTATNKGLTILYKAPEKIRVKGDVIRLNQIFVNLISNAIKYTLKGQIDIVIEAEKSTPGFHLINVTITVTDTGIGISNKNLTKLFQRFIKVSGSEYGGSGLGLHLMKELIALMDGEIKVTSKKNMGSVFKVKLPLGTLTEEENKKFEEQAIKLPLLTSSIPKISLSSQKVLIVDDNEINRKVISIQLTKAGYNCHLAINGIEALKAHEKQVFDLILMDIMMPIMNGIEATKEIRKREEEKRLPPTTIIAISANALERDRKDIVESGINDIIIKPFKTLELLAMIARLNSSNNPNTPKKDFKTPLDSPFNNLRQLQDILNNITAGKKWGVNLQERIWLELENEQEVKKIIQHFHNNGYKAIEWKYKTKLDKEIPVIFLKEIDCFKLKTIPPIELSKVLSIAEVKSEPVLT